MASRKGKLPTLVGGKISEFGNHLTKGKSIERTFRRMFPLTERDVKTLHKAITEDLRRYRKGYSWFYVSFLTSILGAVYGAGWKLFDDEDDEKWERKWFSTPAVDTPKALHQAIDDTLLTKLDRMLRGRPAWILRFRLVMLKNHPRNAKPTSSQSPANPPNDNSQS